MGSFPDIAGSNSRKEVIKKSQPVLEEIASDLEEVIEIDEAQNRYIDNERLTEREQDLMKDLKGEIMLIDDGINPETFDSYADFLNFLDQLAVRIGQSSKSEIIVEQKIERDGLVDSQYEPKNREFLARIYGDIIEILQDLHELLGAIEEFEDRNDNPSQGGVLPILRDTDVIRGNIEGEIKAIRNWAAEIDVDLN